MCVLKPPRGFVLCVLIPLFLGAAHAANDTPALLVSPPPSPATQYVRDLLVLDAAAALNAEADKAQTYSPPSPLVPGHGYRTSGLTGTPSLSGDDNDEADSLALPRDVMRLKAIWGVGTRLSALLDINGQTWVYRAGRAAALAGPHAGIRLIKIATPCAEFLLANGQSDTHCMSEGAP